MKKFLMLAIVLLYVACAPKNISGVVVGKEYVRPRVAMQPTVIGTTIFSQHYTVPEKYYLLIADSVKVHRYRVSERDYNTFVEGDTVSYGQ